MSYCPACGHHNVDSVKFCEKCGESQPESANAAPSAPGTAATTPASSAMTSASGAAKDAMGKVSANPMLAVAAVAIIIIGLMGYNAFLKPMDARAYENAVDDHWDDALEAMSDAESAYYDWYNETTDYEEIVDPTEWASTEVDILEGLDARDDSLRKLANLRAPKEYADEQADIKAGVVFLLDYSSQLRDIAENAPGQEAGNVAEDWAGVSEDAQGDNGGEWENLYDALGKVLDWSE